MTKFNIKPFRIVNRQNSPKRPPRAATPSPEFGGGTGRGSITNPARECAIIARRLNDNLQAQGKPAWYTSDDIDPVTLRLKDGR